MYYPNLLTCPVCGTQLQLNEKSLVCANAHSFDLAKEGYVNLLLKKLTGDTKEMMQARRHFFARGYYEPLSNALNALLWERLAQTTISPSSLHILDAGCGEGYYLHRLQHFLQEQGQISIGLGIDISKDAIRMAAKQYRDAFFIVANLKDRLVLTDQTLQVMLNIFAPRNVPEYARVLKPQGLLCVVIPGVEHLQQLRTQLKLLTIEENKQQHVVEQFTPHFTLLHIQRIRYDLSLQQDEIAQVVMMTPNYWHLSEATKLAMSQIESMTTTIDFVCLLFER